MNTISLCQYSVESGTALNKDKANLIMGWGFLHYDEAFHLGTRKGVGNSDGCAATGAKLLLQTYKPSTTIWLPKIEEQSTGNWVEDKENLVWLCLINLSSHLDQTQKCVFVIYLSLVNFRQLHLNVLEKSWTGKEKETECGLAGYNTIYSYLLQCILLLQLWQMLSEWHWSLGNSSRHQAMSPSQV